MLVARCFALCVGCSLLVAFPLSLLVNPPERLETVPYSRYYMLAMLGLFPDVGTVPRTVRKSGAFGDRALQPIALASLFTHCSLLVARCFSPLVVRQPGGTVGNRSLQPRCSSTLRRARGSRPTTSLLSPFSSLIARCSSLFPSRCSLLFFSPRSSPVFLLFP